VDRKRAADAVGLGRSDDGSGGFDPAGDAPTLVFMKEGNQMKLIQIWLSDRDGWDVLQRR
jgi:hypothetical protein